MCIRRAPNEEADVVCLLVEEEALLQRMLQRDREAVGDQEVWKGFVHAQCVLWWWETRYIKCHERGTTLQQQASVLWNGPSSANTEICIPVSLKWLLQEVQLHENGASILRNIWDQEFCRIIGIKSACVCHTQWDWNPESIFERLNAVSLALAFFYCPNGTIK